jgi:hypothetical protein
MKKYALALSLLISTGVHPQTTFSFSGLTWGMSLAATVAQLNSASINVSTRDRLLCKVSSDCWLRFDDGEITPPKTVEGRAQFVSGALVSVEIEPEPYQAAKREAKLRQSYGAPESVDNSQCNLGPGWCNRLFWRSKLGETIQFNNGGWIGYRSAAINSRDAKAKDMNENRVRF